MNTYSMCIVTGIVMGVVSYGPEQPSEVSKALSCYSYSNPGEMV